MKNSLIKTLLIALSIFMIQSCVKDKFDTPPTGCIDDFDKELAQLEAQGLITKINISDLKQSFVGLLDTALYIEGVVIADDKSGNYYKEIIIQDQTGGIAILIDKNSFYVEFPIGRKVYVKVQGLKLESNAGVIKLGATDIQGTQIRIPNALVPNYFIKGLCNQEVIPQTVTINSLNPALISTLIKLDNVEFLDGPSGATFADAANFVTLNRTVQDCNQNTIIVRTSGYAEFASTAVPSGNGSLYAVYSVFNNTAQLFVRDLNDVADMVNIRCDGSSANDSLSGTTRFHVDDIKVAQGTTVLLEQDFESTSGSGSIAITGWVSYSEVGTVSWSLDNFSGNKYARISGFNSGSPDIVSWMISPAFSMSATSNEEFSCRVQTSFDDGAILQVLFSTDYPGAGNPSDYTWTDINANIPQGPATGFGTFQNVGPINLPSSNSANAYIAFRYLGGE
jgi:hypothetical protein